MDEQPNRRTFIRSSADKPAPSDHISRNSSGGEPPSRHRTGRHRLGLRNGKRLPPAERMGKTHRRYPAVAQGDEQLHRPLRRVSQQAAIRRRRHWTLVTLYLLLALVTVGGIFTSPGLTIQKIRVSGLATLPDTERTETLNVLSVPYGTNWFLAPLKLRKLRASTSRLPWVREVTVERDWSRMVHANVTIRQPLFALGVGESRYEADREGTPIRIERTEMQGRLPEIVFTQPVAVVPGQPVTTPGLLAAIKVLQTLEHERAVRIAKIVIDQNDNLCLNMLDGMQLELGRPDDIDSKIDQVQKIYARDADIGKRLLAINLSCPSSPACTPRLALVAPPNLGSYPYPGMEATSPPSNVTP